MIPPLECVASRLEIVDPGFVRTRRGVRAVCATVLAWATMAAVTTAFDVASPLRITLFAAGAAFEGALLAPDPLPRDRLRTLGWAAAVCAIAVVATVQLTLIAVWVAAILLVLLMFSSYALRGWNPRIASLALMGAITVYVTGGGYITVGRIGWFVLAAAIGFGWLAVWEGILLPDDPLRSLQQSVQAFSRCTADTVAGVVGALNAVRDAPPTDRARKVLHTSFDRVQSCRDAVERQYPGAIARGVSPAGADRLRVALHSAQKGLQDMVEQVDAPERMQSRPDELAWSIASTLLALADALRDDGDGEARALAARRAQVLRAHLHEATTQAATTGVAPFDAAALLASLTILDGGEVVAQSVTQARSLVAEMAEPLSQDQPAAVDPPSPLERETPSPTMRLAIQAVVAAVAAGAIARALGNEQSLVVAWTAFVIIAGSAGLSARRAMVRIPATILGAVGGVLIAATVPDTVAWTIVVVAVGVFFTIVSAPVSYPAMVFWMSIAFVPLFASEGRYLDLIWDKTIAALIGGCVAAVVSLAVFPIRSTREIRPAVDRYLDALDGALATYLPGGEQGIATAEAKVDSAHAALTATVTAAAAETNVFSQSANVGNDEVDQVDVVHDAYRRLTPLLSDSSRRLHGWSDERVIDGIGRLRAAIEDARSPARGEAVGVAVDAPLASAAASLGLSENLGLSDSIRRVEDVQVALVRLAALLRPAG